MKLRRTDIADGQWAYGSPFGAEQQGEDSLKLREWANALSDHHALVADILILLCDSAEHLLLQLQRAGC